MSAATFERFVRPLKRVRAFCSRLHHAGHAAHAVHAGGDSLVVGRKVGNHAVGREDQRSDRCGVLKCRAGHLRRIEHAHFNHIAVLGGLSVVAEVAFTLSDGVHHDARFIAGIGDDLTQRLFHGAQNDADTSVLFVIVALDVLDGESGDVEVLDEFGLDVLNQDTIKGYRILFEQLHGGHPWNSLENDEFLMKLRAVAKNKNGALSPTIAGLLFFGEAYHITEILPNYFLDYREECDDKAIRWLFRIHSNEGDWSGNIYDFFCKVRTRMDDEVAVPFVNRRDGYRIDRVDVHDALEEALANALAHANYYGRRGILVVKKGKELSISNPGTIRVTKEEFYAGGNSDPRNPNILKMFGFVNVGERAGSGIDKIMTAWAEQNWKKPEFDFSERNDRVTLKLEVGQVVYIPGAADIRNTKESSGSKITKEMSKEDKILDYIRKNESISTQKVMEICSYNSRTGARNLLDKMVNAGLIEKVGESRKTHYKIRE